MIGGGIQQIEAVKRLKKIGYNVAVVDRDIKCECFKYADYKINVDCTDIKKIVTWILLKRKKINIKGIFTLTNQAFTVASVAEICKIKSLPTDKVIKFDNKFFIKFFLKKFGFSTPGYKVINSLIDLRKTIKKRKKYYIKITDNNGGKGIRRVDSKNYKKTYTDLVKNFNTNKFIVEEDIAGNYLDLQGIFHNKKFFRAGTCDSYFSNNLKKFSSFNPVEYLNIAPSQLPPKLIDKAYNLLKKICEKMKIDTGPVGADFVIKNDKIYVIEVGPRIHGPNGSLKIMPEATGMKIVEFLGKSVCNEKKIDKNLLKIKKKDVAICKVFLEKQMPKKHGFKKNINKSPGVFGKFVYKIKKENFYNNSFAGIASVYVKGANLLEAKKNLIKANKFYFSKF